MGDKFPTVMTTDGASDGVFSGSAPSSAPGSPRNRIKFLCSHGGRILPRPPDGQLKYVGGETRVISVAPDISYQELMKKLTSLIDGEMILKYQPTSEDLDALVSVKSDEDVSFMCEEIKRCESAGNSRLRAFLFPANPISMENQMSIVDPPLEQRYIDAVNGITRSASKQHLAVVNSMQHGSRVSSGCSSPTSPDSWTAEAVSSNEPVLLPSNTYHHNGRMIGMHKVHSSPNICGSTMSANVPQQSHHFIHQLPQPQPQPQPQLQPQPQYFHHYPPGSGSLKPPIDLPRNETRLTSMRSVGRADGVRYQLVDPSAPAPAPPRYYFTQMQGGHGCWHYDESNRFLAGKRFPAPQPMNPVLFRLGPAHTDSI